MPGRCHRGVDAGSLCRRREAARLAARGDDRSAVDAARRIAPTAARIQVHRDGDFFVATVVAHSKLLPTLDIAAKAVSAAKPSLASGRYPRDDRGSATVVAAARGAAVRHGRRRICHRAQAAADLAALAGAALVPSGVGAACAGAMAVTCEMRVDDARCAVDDLDVVVIVWVAVVFAGAARAAARAGPVGMA